MTLDEIEILKINNYVRVAQPENDYWVDFSQSKLNARFISNYSFNFNIIIYSKLNIDFNLYVIPFEELADLFTEEFLARDKSKKRRWVASIKNHIFKVSNCQKSVDVKNYYFESYQRQKPELSKETNEYKIENILREVAIRVKQSKFRKEVLANFHNCCCICGISEKELLVASHIVPWASEKDTRLDPLNGLSLFVLYDKLFDSGYFTLTKDNSIVTFRDKNLSKVLTAILDLIDGKKISVPIVPLREKYLHHHREQIFKGRNDYIIL